MGVVPSGSALFWGKVETRQADGKIASNYWTSTSNANNSNNAWNVNFNNGNVNNNNKSNSNYVRCVRQ
jgi:uncharacterized protein (TIGR02145 family)